MGYGIRHEIRAANNGGGGAAIAVDNDPNTTEPPETRVFDAPPKRSAGDTGLFAYAMPDTNGLSIRLRAFERTMNRWFALGAATTVCTADMVNTLAAVGAAPSIPSGARLFAQVTANAANCARVGIGFYEE